VATHDAELRAFWQLGVSATTEPLERVLGRYRQAHRRYHTVAHLGWVLRHVEQLSEEVAVDDLGSVVAAAFFHDAVYDPTSTSNEDDSAALAVRELVALGWEASRADTVAAMIRGTAAHRDPPDRDTAVLFDADLAVLGADPAGYGDYVRGVRAEHGHVDDAGWRAGRAAVLRSFLDRPAIYATEPGRARWESTARANITAELAGLAPSRPAT